MFAAFFIPYCNKHKFAEKMDQSQRQRCIHNFQRMILLECLLIAIATTTLTIQKTKMTERTSSMALQIEQDYIKWVDFTVSYEAMCKAYDWDVESYGTEYPVSWVDLLALTAAKQGGLFDKNCLKVLDKSAKAITEGKKSLEELTKDLKYFPYYQKAYDAALGGLVGEYKKEISGQPGQYETVYGLKGFFPLAQGFDYTHYDDFGANRSYGYKRKHLGHDMMGLVGTPIMAVESGVVEALGWNQYGGWRIGIRSFDKKRYYYYAHLRQNYPYAEGLAEGSVVTAGDVIGYMGHTGYSTKENVNNIEVTHLHWGLQLIFDESQKEGNNEIWIDIYPLTRFLAKHTQKAAKVGDTREWRRTETILDPKVTEYLGESAGMVQ